MSLAVANSRLSTIKYLIPELEKYQNTDASDIMQRMNTINSMWLKLRKLTNEGKVPKEVKEKVKFLFQWMKEYSADKEAYLLKHVPKKLTNKTVAVEQETLDTSEAYAKLYIKYLANFPAKFNQLKEDVLPLLGMRENLVKNLPKFEIPEEDLLALAAPKKTKKTPEKEEVEAVVYSPAKIVISVQAAIKVLKAFIYSTETLIKELRPLMSSFDNQNLESIYRSFNEKNKLLKSLIVNLAEVRKIILQGDFQGRMLVIKLYQEKLDELEHLLPSSIISRLKIGEFFSPLDEQLRQAPGIIQQYDPLKDRSMWKSPPNMPAREPPKVNPPVPTAPTVKPSLSPEDKAKYEQLWNTASLLGKKYRV